MKLRLKNGSKNEDVWFDLKVDYSYKPSDMIVILSVYQTKCGLSGDNYSIAYDEHYFKKVQNIVVGTFTYNDYQHTVTLGEYLDGTDLNYFLIKDESERYVSFQTLEQEIPFQSFKVCDYTEYKESCEITGNEVLSKKDFINAILNDKIGWNNYALFNTVEDQKDIHLFINAQGLTKF